MVYNIVIFNPLPTGQISATRTQCRDPDNAGYSDCRERRRAPAVCGNPVRPWTFSWHCFYLIFQTVYKLFYIEKDTCQRWQKWFNFSVCLCWGKKHSPFFRFFIFTIHLLALLYVLLPFKNNNFFSDKTEEHIKRLVNSISDCVYFF